MMASPVVRQQPQEVVLFETAIHPLREHGALTHLEGTAALFGVWVNRGFFLESLAAGGFDKSLAEAAAALPLLLFHDDNLFPVGVAEDWKANTKRLDGVWRLDDSDMAQRAATLAKDGMFTGLSVGINPIRSDWQFVAAEDWNPDLGLDHMDRVTRLESRLLETSLVPTPAFDAARVKLVHTATPRRERSLHPRLDAWRQWRGGLDRRS